MGGESGAFEGAYIEGEVLGPEAPSEGATAEERFVLRRFWRKLLGLAAELPFLDDLIAAYYCARDPRTPHKVRAVLVAALAYFIMPVDLVPDLLAGLGFTDDATVLAGAIALVGAHLRPWHRQQAAAALERLRRLARDGMTIDR